MIQDRLSYYQDKFNSISGMKTKYWGPMLWDSLFTCVMGAYPVKINNQDPSHILTRKHFIKMIYSLQYTMPCIYCRNSFKKFIKELPIKNYLGGRVALVYWLYLIKDKVNKKLMAQEYQCYKDNKKKLRELNISKKEYIQLVQEMKKNTLYTRGSPSFITVLKKYEDMRASCSAKTKTCS